MAAALAAVPKSTSPSRHRRLVVNDSSAAEEFELRHWRPAKPIGPWERWAPPPEIEIPNGVGDDDGHGYTSLRDILSSPTYYAASASPAAGGSGSCGDIHIRNPLVKHAAQAYLQPTPSAVEASGRRPQRSPLCRLLLGCLGFIGALFRR